MLIFINLSLFFVGIFLIILGSQLVVAAGISLARRFKITGVAFGALFLSAITAMPETFTTLFSLFEDSAATGFANLVGSNIHNLPLGLGLVALLTPVRFEKFAKRVSLVMILAILLTSLLLIDGQMTRPKGIILLLAYGFYILYLLKKGFNHDQSSEIENKKPERVSKKLILTFILGSALLLFSSYLVVKSSLSLAQAFNLSNFFVAMMIMSLGSILPEVATSFTAALKGEGSVSIGNILGDNIFTLFVVLGLVGVLKPFTISTREFWASILPMFFLTLIVFLITLKKVRKIKKSEALILLFFYLLTLILETKYLGSSR